MNVGSFVAFPTAIASGGLITVAAMQIAAPTTMQPAATHWRVVHAPPSTQNSSSSDREAHGP